MPKIVWESCLLVCTEGALTLNGTELSSSRMERKLLLFLLEHPNIPLSRELLLREVWDYETAGITRTVDTHIKMLRAHLGKMGALIVSVRGVGYCLDTKQEEAEICVCKAS
ncbi:MAG: winged helix-turn-helix transcriptional regulator [Acutalibacter sp.]|nr:winged helix-turn-helix transcriptional regulator [Acutalibacter sp.]